ncbi:MAG TPA: bifunctional homocysteine S-methyltransferase/methylenetetrahydrofolate reductase [Gemmatimonadales bacterium]
MSRSDLLDRLLDPAEIVLFDGAMGTMLYSRGVFINQCYDELNARSPELVRGVHEAYVRAGAEVLETNSFGANRTKLAQHGLEGRVRELNVAAARLARAAAGDDVLVAGAVGPLGVRLEPYGPTSRDEAREIFREQVEALLEGGADFVLLETFGDLIEIEQAVLAARDLAPTLPLVAQMTIGADGRTPFGATAAEVARVLDRFGADVIGLNCSVGPQAILDAIEQMAQATSRKLSAQPNAGMPREVGGRSMYMASPEYMASYARHLVQGGARIVGGCCGTTPEHVRAMVAGVRPLAPRATRIGKQGNRETGKQEGTPASLLPASLLPTGTAPSPSEPFPLSERSNWGRKLAAGEFVSSVEIVPPRGVDASRLLEDAARLRDAGVDAVNVPDGPRAQSRMGAIATSLLLEQRVGIEAVTHYCCRDRNLLGMLSDLLGASALGLRNLLLITGDPPKMGPYPDATAVFDIDAIGLTNLARSLNQGLDPGGNSIGEPTRFVIGVGVNPAAVDPAHELRRFEWKVEAGAEYAITQPVFDVAQLERFLRSIEHVRIPVIAGIWPLVSARNAEFLANEVPGVTVPPAILDRMRRASGRSREHAVAEGIEIARGMLEQVRDSVQGVQVSAPFGKVELALEVMEGVPEVGGRKSEVAS